MRPLVTVLLIVVLFGTTNFLLAQAEEEFPPHPSPTDLEGQMAEVVAASILDTTLIAVVAEVPQLSDLSQMQEPAKLPENFLDIVLELSLADLKRLETLRGQTASTFYIVNVFPFEEGSNYQGFLWEPGSRWLLFLENPLDSTHQDYSSYREVIGKLKAEDFLKPGHFFLLHRNGLAATCIHWPEGAEKTELLIIAPAEFVADVRLILARLQQEKRAPEQVESDESFRNRLKTKLGMKTFDALLTMMEF